MWKASWHNCCQLWRDLNASGKGCVSQLQLHIFLKSRFANVCQWAPSLVNSTKICWKHWLLSTAEPLTLNRLLSFIRTLYINSLFDILKLKRGTGIHPKINNTLTRQNETIKTLKTLNQCKNKVGIGHCAGLHMYFGCSAIKKSAKSYPEMNKLLSDLFP